jgi:hypothetical protein
MKELTMKQLIDMINRVQQIMDENAELKIKVKRLEGEITRLKQEKLIGIIRQDA